MNQVDSAFSRLATAWSSSGTASPASCPNARFTGDRVVPIALPQNDVRCLPVIESMASSSAPWVMVARRKVQPPLAFECGLLASNHFDKCVYRIDPIMVDRIGELEGYWRSRSPRVLLLDIELIRGAGPGAMEQLRRRQPGIDFLVGCDGPMTVLDISVFRHVRGCVDWALSADQMTRALDGVMSGLLWFPRSMMQSVCLDLLEGPHAALDPHESVAGQLTARECEVLTLMRLGLSNKQIGERLDISVNTVKKHLAHVFEKRGLHRRRQVSQ